jgi:branched-chain amino acid transport system ATP-binding protein
VLQVSGIDAHYDDVKVLRGVTLEVAEGELVVIIGANGAGKTTLLRVISGLLKPSCGSISFEGECISDLEPHAIVARGIVHVPEGRLIFPEMTVRENLEMGGFSLEGRERLAESLRSVYALFPVLKERETQLGRTLSGGEQQMLAIGRALMASPRLIMFDEPSLGLAPMLVEEVFNRVQYINTELGSSVLLVEQDVGRSCRVADRGYVIENGEIVLQGTGQELLNNDYLRQAYLGL